MIPSSLVELKEGWCNTASHINKIKVMPNNPIYSSYKNTFIVGKSLPEKENLDVLVFSVRNIKIAKIPSFIKIIDSYSFGSYYKLSHIELQNDSRLSILRKHAFDCSSITSFTIPSHLTIIDQCAFVNCKKT